MHWLEACWYRLSPLHVALWPLSILFGALTGLRRLLYRTGLLPSAQAGIPVIVVGNITVGGTGKTPCVIWLAQWLSDQGFKPGIVSRGYSGSERNPRRAHPDSSPGVVGDEAVLLARRSACPVWIGRSRVAAVRALRAAHPDCNVIISDDGLQHYALRRDVELVVIDSERGWGNGMLLPAGPLREPLTRLAGVDALIINGDAAMAPPSLPPDIPRFDLALEGRAFYNLRDPNRRVDAAYFAGLTVHAMAAIGNPQRFFRHLRRLGISFTSHPYPDHHQYTPPDCAWGEHATVIVTEKDAVKCERMAGEDWWALRVGATPDPALGAMILHKIGK